MGLRRRIELGGLASRRQRIERGLNEWPLFMILIYGCCREIGCYIPRSLEVLLAWRSDRG